MSKLYRKTFHQHLPASLDMVWDFISSPQNLKNITPPYMGFDILTDIDSNSMYAGQIISYVVRPVFHIKMHWVTEISHVVEKKYFVDEQRFGPYALWHHKHFLKPANGGVQMTDIIDYKIPYGILGDLANVLMVSKKIDEIFAYRFNKLNEIFG